MVYKGVSKHVSGGRSLNPESKQAGGFHRRHALARTRILAGP
jgi:hypothetical protein